MKALVAISVSGLATFAALAALTIDTKDGKSVVADTDPANKIAKSDEATPAGKALETFAAGEHEKGVALAKPLAEKGDALALYILGFAHETGQGIEASQEKAVEYYRKAALKKNADSIYRLSSILMSSGEKDRVEEGRELLEKQAETDPAVAGRILGEAFLAGRLTGEPAPETGISWWKKAAEAGDVPSMFLLGRFYDGQFGHASLADPKLAIGYFLKAAEEGDSGAMVAAGSRLLNSKEIELDEKKGNMWLNKAIEQKEYSAYLALGDYEENTKKDLDAALAYYTKGAEAGQPDCMIRAADFHLSGKGTEKDAAKGVGYLEKAAEAGSSQAHLMLAAKILEGEKPDLGAAYAHLLKAANGGLPLAQNELGLFYLSGKLGVADISAAVSWLDRAAKAGLASAQNNLGALYERGAGVQQSYANAAKLYSLAAQQGNASATLALARFHAAGAATKVDRPRAWALATVAAENGEKSEKENAIKLIAELEKIMTKEELAAANKGLADIKLNKPAE